MSFREMDPEKVREMLSKTENLLSPLIEKEEAFFRIVSCPRCNGLNSQAFVDPQRPFVPGSVLPHKLLRCLDCRVEFDPYTRLILHVPTDESA